MIEYYHYARHGVIYPGFVYMSSEIVNILYIYVYLFCCMGSVQSSPGCGAQQVLSQTWKYSPFVAVTSIDPLSHDRRTSSPIQLNALNMSV